MSDDNEELAYARGLADSWCAEYNRVRRERDEARSSLAVLRDSYGAGLDVAVRLFQPGGKHPGVLRLGDHIIPAGLTWLDAERDRLLAEVAQLRQSRILGTAPAE